MIQSDRNAILVGLALAALVFACQPNNSLPPCPNGEEPVLLAQATSCVIYVVETGFLCAAETPHRYELDEAVVCSSRPDLADGDVEAIVREYAARPASPAPDAGTDAPPDSTTSVPDAAPADVEGADGAEEEEEEEESESEPEAES